MIVFQIQSCPIKLQISKKGIERVLKGSVSVNSSDSQCKDDNAQIKKKYFFSVLGLEEDLREAKDM